MMKPGGGLFFEIITACPAGENHLVNISLVYGESFAHLQTKFVVNAAKTVSLQHGASKNK